MFDRVKRLHKEGIIRCDNASHYFYINQGIKVSPQPPQTVIDLMVPYVEAKCYCERQALNNYKYWQQPVGTMAHRFICEGALCVGFGEKPTPGHASKRVCPVPYQLSKTDREELHACFPNYLFYCKQNAHHDHPISHTKTMICAAIMMDALPKGTIADPVHALDLFGNPGPNERRNASDARLKVHTTCHETTPKDALRRVQKWGDEVDANGKRRWHDLYVRDVGKPGMSFDHQDMAKVEHITCTHTLYYLAYEEIYELLDRCAPRAVLHAVVHKFGPGTNGTLNNGELEWYRESRGVKDPTTGLIADPKSWITQIGADSKETYDHRDTDRFFNGPSHWAVAKKHNHDRGYGITWTSRKLTRDVYLVEFTKFDPTAVGVVEDFAPPEVVPGKVDPLSPNEIRRHGGVPLYIKTGVEIHPILPEHAQVFDDLRKRIGSKPRTADTWRSHVSMCKINAKSKGAPPCTAQQLADLTCLSFWSGYEHELNNSVKLFDSNHTSTMLGVRLARYGAYASGTGVAGVVMRVAETVGSKHLGVAIAKAIVTEVTSTK